MHERRQYRAAVRAREPAGLLYDARPRSTAFAYHG